MRNVTCAMVAASGAAIVLAGSPEQVEAQTVGLDLHGDSGRIAWEPDGLDPTEGGSFHSTQVGQYVVGSQGGSGRRRVAATVLMFELPEVPQGMYFGDAAFTADVENIHLEPTRRVDLWGVGYRSTPELDNDHWFAGEAGDPWFNDFAGSGDNIPSQTLLQEELISIPDPADPEASEGQHSTSAVAGTTLADFLNDLYDHGAQAGDYAVLRLNSPWFDPEDGAVWRYEMSDNHTLNATLVPEPGTLGLAAIAGGALLLRRRRDA